jgi:putative ABC transport system ATP-binding protein
VKTFSASAPAPLPILRGSGLCRTYWLDKQPVTGVTDLDVDVWPGELTALEGPSGSGKTTLLNLLGLLDAPDSGSLLLDGADVHGLDERQRAAIRRDRFGFVFQTFNLIPVLTAVENVEYPMALCGVEKGERRARALALLGQVGLGEKANARPDLLSGGQRQRVAIARALANGPEVVFADEPTAALDSRTAGEILDLMVALNRERGVAFLFATHDHRVVERARRVLTLCDGRVVSDQDRGGAA